jgi:hypothetical protein
MINVYVAAGTFADKHALGRDLAAAVLKWEQVPPISLFEKNAAAFIHDLPCVCRCSLRLASSIEPSNSVSLRS